MSQKHKHISIILVGHVTSGLSTTTGRLIYEKGVVGEEYLKKHEKVSEENAIGAKYSWVLEKLKSDRERGETIDDKLWKFETERYQITVVDTPGHGDFIRNMITGRTVADAALVLIDATPAAFHVGMSEDGQTVAHFKLIYQLGIEHVVIGVNKMDAIEVNYKKERFDQIVQKLGLFLPKVGLSLKKVPVIPISAKQGVNIVRPHRKLGWWKGPSLWEGINSLRISRRAIHKPLRIPVTQAFEYPNVGVVASGRVATGLVKPGMKIFFAPCNIFSEIKTVEMCKTPILQAFPEDEIVFGVEGVSEKELSAGNVCGNSDRDPPRSCEKFYAMVFINSEKFRENAVVNLEIHTTEIKCRLVKLLKRIDRRSGVIEEGTKALKKRECGIWEIEPTGEVVVETFREYPTLGRFVVREDEDVLAEGIVIRVFKK